MKNQRLSCKAFGDHSFGRLRAPQTKAFHHRPKPLNTRAQTGSTWKKLSLPSARNVFSIRQQTDLGYWLCLGLNKPFKVKMLNVCLLKYTLVILQHEP